jgi:hypothetical protein
VRALAAFAASDFGRYYAGLHRYWGTDPAAFLEEEDDLMALNLRAALTRVLASEPEPEPESHTLRLASRLDG